MRVVVDPNVFVSAAISNGASRRVVRVAAAGGFQVVACPRLLDELGGVLHRRKFEKYRSREDLDRFERQIRLLVVVLPDPKTIEPLTRDAADDYLVALALEQDVDLICSGDHDFDNVVSPAVVTPGELLQNLMTEM